MSRIIVGAERGGERRPLRRARAREMAEYDVGASMPRHRFADERHAETCRDERDRGLDFVGLMRDERRHARIAIQRLHERLNCAF